MTFDLYKVNILFTNSSFAQSSCTFGHVMNAIQYTTCHARTVENISQCRAEIARSGGTWREVWASNIWAQPKPAPDTVLRSTLSRNVCKHTQIMAWPHPYAYHVSLSNRK